MVEKVGEVEVTQEMIEAGEMELAGFSPFLDDPKEVVASIYSAMLSKRQKLDRVEQADQS